MATIQQQVETQKDLIDQEHRLPASTRPMNGLKAVVLLGGSVKSQSLAQSIGRSMLDLPLDANGSILDQWQRQAEDLASALGCDRLSVRLVIDQKTPPPASEQRQGVRMDFRTERDPVELRGTAGLLRDLVEPYDDQEWILAASSGQVLLEPLSDLFNALAAVESDVCLISHEDGSPSSLMLIRCGCLRSVARVGFVDMKEQALHDIAMKHRVTVLRRTKPVGLPIMTPAAYIQAVRSCHQLSVRGPSRRDPLSEDWQAMFSLVEDPTSVDATAQIYDSVVLRGARVQRGAVLVRSIVCPGSIVRSHATIMDSVVTNANGRQR